MKNHYLFLNIVTVSLTKSYLMQEYETIANFLIFGGMGLSGVWLNIIGMYFVETIETLVFVMVGSLPRRRLVQSPDDGRAACRLGGGEVDAPRDEGVERVGELPEEHGRGVLGGEAEEQREGVALGL